MITKSGLHSNAEGNDRKLDFNGKGIDSVPLKFRNAFGTYALGKRLYVDGVPVAQSEIDAGVREEDDNAYLNEVLLTSQGECINITIEDYNTLFAGGLVDGYKRYTESAIYNIVDDVSSAPKVSYEIEDGVITFEGGVTAEEGKNVIYNNANGIEDNEIDLAETMSNGNPPFAFVKWFNPIVPVGGTISLSYHVDDQMMSSTNYDTIDKTFTVIVRTAAGQVVKKTTYAGDFKITTPAFSTAGETWFSVEVIDSDGVGSPVQYFDILVRNAVVAYHYEMQQSDLETYGIKAGNCTQTEAYNNKAALTALFAWAKQEGYNGIKMINAVYYIDYHKNISDVDGEIDFGSQTYYKAMVENKIITSVDVVDESVAIQAPRTYPVDSIPVVGGSCDTTDEYRIFVLNTAQEGDRIEFPSEFTIDMNGATIAALPSTDLSGGSILNIKDNFCTIIKNGKVFGNFRNYDFDLASIKIGNPNPSEWLAVSGFHNSRYCYFEEMEFAYSVGYEAGAGAENNWRQFATLQLTGNQAVDLSSGSMIEKPGMVTTQRIDVSGYEEISIGRGGYAGFQMGKRREVFFSFYGDNDVYICTTKSFMYFPCKVPSGAKSVIMTGYGAASDWPITNYNGSLSLRRDKAFSVNVGYKNSYWHHTRTCASAPFSAKGFCLIGCTYDNIAIQTDKYGVTTVLGDIEDGGQDLFNVVINDCSCSHGQNIYTIGSCLGLTFSNNSNISVIERIGVEYGTFDKSTCQEHRISRSKDNPRPFVVYDGNKIGTLIIEYNGQLGNYWDAEPIPVIAMEDSVIQSYCAYDGLKLKNSINGSEKVL